MGSEHYCLRWNNHQSNLLGVFSQLLQDESLVDVTLACSEGAPIRAHKVVLSACSSYFQSLFLDHPEKHPIVILKDVGFAELQTLVEFMYKGEVNVQYCQLSALLKTAESLKVKGLAEMTNQNTTLREPEREPDRLRPHSQPSKSTCDSPVDETLAATSAAATSSASITGANGSGSGSAAPTSGSSSSGAATASAPTATASSSHKREASERSSASPPKRLQTTTSTTTKPLAEQDSPLALDLYQRRPEHEEGSERARTSDTSAQQARHSASPGSGAGGSGSGASGTSNPHNDDDERDALHSPGRPASGSTHGGGSEAHGGVEKIEDVDDYDEDMDLNEEGDNSSNEIGLNMKISVAGHIAAAMTVPSPLSGSGGGGVGGGGGGAEPESARSTPAATTTSIGLLPSDLTQRPASRSSREVVALERPSSSGVCGLLSTPGGSLAVSGMSPSSSTAARSGGVLDVGGDALAGASVLGPVQSVPLSLKKEIECSEDDNSNSRHMAPRSASAGGGLGGGELDYRASHESETSVSPHGGCSGAGGSAVAGGGSGIGNAMLAGGASSSSAAAHERPQTPPSVYPCVYCGAAFPHQSKLTRHILSHSLKTLECRETATHPLLHQQLLTHELNIAQQQFAYQMNAAAMVGSGDPQEQVAAVTLAAAAAMEMDFAAMVAATSCPLSGIAACSARGALDLDGSGGGVAGSGAGDVSGGTCTGGSRGGVGSSAGNGGVGGSAGGGLLLSGAGSSSSTSAAAAAAAAAVASTSSALLGASSSDPNSVVLCKFCCKSFPDVASLITHLPVHTGDRPFKCEFCGKAFKLRHHMKDHCRVHTGERPFRCHMCGKTFSRSTILKAHEKTHFPKYVRKFLSPSPVDTKDELPQ